MELSCASCHNNSVAFALCGRENIDGKEVFIYMGKCDVCGSIYTITMLRMIAS